MSHSGNERRKWPRIPASSLEIASAAIVAGPAVKLVDLSRGGALLEVASRFALRSSVRLKLTRSNGEVITVDGCVARAKVAGFVNGQINYRFVVTFDQPITLDLPGLPSDVQPQEQVSVASPDCPPAVPSASEAVQAQAPAAESEPADIVPPARPNLVAVPSGPIRLARKPSPSGNSREGTDRFQPIAADTRVDDLRKELAAANAELARYAAVNQSLKAKLEESADRQTSLHAELETMRRRREEQEVLHAQQVADAISSVAAVQEALSTQEQKHAQAIAEEQSKYEALIAELVQSSNDQQTEYQQLVDELTVTRDEERCRAEAQEAELARLRAAEEQHRVESDESRRELEARLETLEALCAAHEARYTGLRREAEKLMSMFSAQLRPGAAQPADVAPTAVTDKVRACG